MYKDLEDLLQRSTKSSEIKRGLAVKQDLALKSRKLIGEILDVGSSFISKWRLIYDEYGVNALVCYHKGGSPRSFLTEGQRAHVIAHIKTHELFSPKDLAVYLKSEYDVSFMSSQSYYNLLHEAKMSYHKSQKVNPRRDESKIASRREDIKKNSISIEKR